MSPVSTRMCVPNLVAVRRGGGVQRDRQTDRQRKLQLYIVDYRFHERYDVGACCNTSPVVGCNTDSGADSMHFWGESCKLVNRANCDTITITHSLIWRPSRVADTPPLLPISRNCYCLVVADVCLCSEVLQPGGSRSSSGSGSM